MSKIPKWNEAMAADIREADGGGVVRHSTNKYMQDEIDALRAEIARPQVLLNIMSWRTHYKAEVGYEPPEQPGHHPMTWAQHEIDCLRAELAKYIPDCKFKVNDAVTKVTGDYKIHGVVRSVFTMANGAVRLAVEHKAEGGGSFLHIYAEANLEPHSAKDCQHAAPFRFCPSCVIDPCPIGLGAKD